mgnify:FL=1|tara:strand:+ start:221 stop:877 length:657 start_codon:yes stop_codon:yes gene_type:complete
MGYTPYKMKGSPMYRNYGIGKPPKGTTGESPVEGKSPAKGWFSKMAKKAGNFIKGGGPIGMAVKGIMGKKGGGGGGEDLEARVAALESGGGGGAEAGVAGAGAEAAGVPGGGDGDPANAKQAMMEKHRASVEKMAGVGNSMSNLGMSDIRLKEKIEKAGKSPSGIPIYEFNYIGGNSRYEGAMAQDLISMGIDAVEMQESGYYAVDYSKIDVDMKLIN